MLDKLPVEILRMVIREVECERNVLSLSQTSKCLHRFLVPIIYEKFVVRAREEYLSRLETPPSLKIYSKSGDSQDQNNEISFVKELQFLAPVNLLRRRRCYHGAIQGDDGYIDDMTEEEKNSNQITHDTVMKDLLYAFNNSIQFISKYCLQSFTWGLGCCIPDEIIGADGYLSKSQTRIQSLSLTTDGSCMNILRDYSGLLELKQLRHLSWKGLDSETKGPILRQLLKANCKHLESLELEMAQMYDQRAHIDDFTEDPVFTNQPLHFPGLRHLALTGISLYSAYDWMELAFPLFELQSLRIRNCIDGLEVLKGMAKARKPIKLQCLEIVYTEERGDEDYKRLHPVYRFLKSFKGLQELYISLRDLMFPFRDLHKAIFRHRATLKRLVHHEREWDIDRRSERYELVRDSVTPWFGDIDNMIDRMKRLECIGITISPLYLKDKYETSARLTYFKLLHFRITARHYGDRDLLAQLKAAGYSPDDGTISKGNWAEVPRRTTSQGGPIRTSLKCKQFICMEDLLKFTQWAFGPRGFAGLKVLAYGDFSHGKRFKWSQLLFCRIDPTPVSSASIGTGVQPATFRIMTKDDEYLLDQIQGSREMLSACTVEQILDCEDEGDGAEESNVDPDDTSVGVLSFVRGGATDNGDDDFVDDDSVDSLEQELLNDGFN